MNQQYQGKIDPDKLDSDVGQPTTGDPNRSEYIDVKDVRGGFSPARFLVTTIGGIFLAEVTAMVVLFFFQNWPYYLQIALDASIMVVLIYPVIYFLSLKPLLYNIEERKSKEKALRRYEERFALAYRSNPAALCILRARDLCLIDVNDSFLKLYGYSREEVIGHDSEELNLYPNSQHWDELKSLLIDPGSVQDYELTTKVKSGELRTVSVSIEAIELEGEAHILAIASDITERKRSDDRLRLSNRALEMLSQCNQALVRAEDETEFLEKMCEIIVRVGGYRMAWVGFAEQDQNKSVRPVAKSGFEEGYLSLVQISWADTELGRGPTGSAIRTCAIQVNQNFQLNPNVTPWRAAALERGYQASISLPIVTGDLTLGALTIYSQIPDAFDAEEVGQLSKLADDLTFGIQALRDRSERRRAEERTREMALFPTLNPDAVLQVDARGYIKTSSPAAGHLGFCIGAQLTDIMPDLPDLDLAGCIANRCTWQIPETRLGERVLLWTVQGAPELGLAFLYSTDITERKQAEDMIRRLSLIVEQTEDTVVVTNVDGVIQYVNPAFERLTGYALEEALGKTPRVLKSGLQDHQFYGQLWNTILGGDAFLAEMANRKKNGALFYEIKTITPLRNDQGEITHFVATGKDITQHKHAEQELARRNLELQAISNLEHDERQLAQALVDAALVLNGSLKLRDVLTHILEQIKKVIPYQLADIALLDGETFYDAGHQGDMSWPANLSGIANHLPVDDFPSLKKMMLTGQPVLFEDTRKESDWVIENGLEWCRSYLAAPLLVDGQVIGFVSLFAAQPGFFAAGMTRKLVGFAAQAAVAIQNAWLFEQAQASAQRLQSLSRRLVEVQENERLYISRELHDEAGQLLTSLLFDLQLLEKKISQPEAVVKIVEEMESSVHTVLGSLHRIAMSLRPASLDHVGLAAALRQQAESVCDKHGLKLRLKIANLEERLSENVESVLYRIAQEALTNIVRYARVSSVDVVLMLRDGQLILIVEDDGIGFDPETVGTGDHLGLFGMRERTEMIGGKLTIESALGKGTIIMVEVGYADTVGGRG